VFRKYTSVFRPRYTIASESRLFRKKGLPRIFLVAVHVFCCVIIKLAIAHRAFSSWCPFYPPSPPRLFPAPSSTLNRIKVAGEKQVGINRTEERRAAATEIRRTEKGVAFHPFFSHRLFRWERKRREEKREKSICILPLLPFLRGCGALWWSGWQRKDSTKQYGGECNATHRCFSSYSFLSQILYFSSFFSNIIVFILKYPFLAISFFLLKPIFYSVD